MKRTLSLILVLAMIASLAIFTPASAASAKDSVVVGCAAEPDCFFPGHSKLSTNMDEVPILHNVYESLIKLGPNNEREPLLATEWSVSEDGKVYTVKLREGVKFSNGNDFNAEDAAFALNLYGPSPNGAAQLGNYDYTEALDEYTIAIHLTDPYAPFLNALAGRYALMFDKETYEEVGEDGLNEHPIGTGPYLFTERVSGNYVKLDYNPNYWGGEPAIKHVTWRVLTDTNTQMIALESGEIDVLTRANIAALQNLMSDQVIWQAKDASSIENLVFNCAVAPTNDINFRKAVQYAINKADINIGVFNGAATEGDIPIAPGFSGRPDAGTYEVIEYNPEKAKEYLAASNYNGEPFEINLTYLADTEAQAGRGVIAAYDQLTKFGLKCNLSSESSATWDTNAAIGSYDIAGYWPTGGITRDLYSQINGWDADLIVPLGERGSGQGSRWNNAEATEIIHKLAKVSATSDESYELGMEFVKIAIQDMPFIGFHSGVKFVPTNSTYWANYPCAENPYNGPWWWWSCFKYITTEITPAA